MYAGRAEEVSSIDHDVDNRCYVTIAYILIVHIYLYVYVLIEILEMGFQYLRKKNLKSKHD